MTPIPTPVPFPTALPTMESIGDSLFTNSAVLNEIFGSSAFARMIFFALFLLSIITWAIVAKKIWDFRVERFRSRSFRDLFARVEGDILSLAQEGIIARNSPSRIFVAAYDELRLWTRLDPKSNDLISDKPIATPLERTLDRAIDREQHEWEWGCTTLATVASISPLLGLLGTVWGVFHSFYNVGTVSNPSLQTVAPGISEALLTTVVGLMVAIPALVAHNTILSRVRRIEQDLESFASQILNSFERQVHVRSSADKP
ncbi:MAG: MotA/TolQ/ExbB proton channel family protein [bacterium]